MNTLPAIKDAQLVAEAFGYFPTFHDAEVMSLICDRGETCSGSPTLEMVLHVWELTSDLTASRHYRLQKHHLVHFRFEGVDSVELLHWSHQNVIFELIVNELEQPNDHALLSIELSSSVGLEGKFRAVSGQVVSVVPCDEAGIRLG